MWLWILERPFAVAFVSTRQQRCYVLDELGFPEITVPPDQRLLAGACG
jgi:hypothetical protein